MAFKIFAIYWALFWLGTVLICLRDEDGKIINEIIRPVQNGGFISIIYIIIIMIMIPISVPFAIVYFLRK